MIDEKTGLRELPEGMFWRFQPSGNDGVTIQIRRKRWYGSALVTQSHFYHRTIKSGGLNWCTGVVLEKIKEETDPHEHLYGDYPPKKVGK